MSVSKNKTWQTAKITIAILMTISGIVLLLLTGKSLCEAFVIYQSFNFMTVVYSTFVEAAGLIIISFGLIYFGLRTLKSFSTKISSVSETGQVDP